MTMTQKSSHILGSHNENDHSGTRDGFQEWGDSNIKDTVVIIDFLAKRFNKLNFYSYYKVPYILLTANFFFFFSIKWFENAL